MAWADEPTRMQIGALMTFLMDAGLDETTITKALKYLSTHANRKEFSTEMGRIRDLQIAHKLDKNTCFESPIWGDFKEKNIKSRSLSEIMAEIRELREKGNN